MAETIPFSKSGDEPSPTKAPPEPRSYSNEEVSEIIRVALRGMDETRSNTVAYSEMLSIARDFGLTEHDISRAFDEINQTRHEKQIESKVQLSLKVHALVFAVVQVALFAINGLSGAENWWALYVLVSWGALLALHVILSRYVPAAVHKMLTPPDWDGGCSVDSAGTEQVRFSIPELYHGLAKSTGMLRIDEDCLVIEFETTDTVFGALKSGVREVSVPIQELASVRLDRQFWNTKLILRGHRLKSFEDVPGHNAGEVRLTLDKQARVEGERIVRELSRRLDAR